MQIRAACAFLINAPNLQLAEAPRFANNLPLSQS